MEPSTDGITELKRSIVERQTCTRFSRNARPVIVQELYFHSSNSASGVWELYANRNLWRPVWMVERTRVRLRVGTL